MCRRFKGKLVGLKSLALSILDSHNPESYDKENAKNWIVNSWKPFTGFNSSLVSVCFLNFFVELFQSLLLHYLIGRSKTCGNYLFAKVDIFTFYHFLFLSQVPHWLSFHGGLYPASQPFSVFQCMFAWWCQRMAWTGWRGARCRSSWHRQSWGDCCWRW